METEITVIKGTIIGLLILIVVLGQIVKNLRMKVRELEAAVNTLAKTWEELP